ncbi:MAG TPA: hypothetical protein VGM62_20255 [Chthoniobacterales bacterium]
MGFVGDHHLDISDQSPGLRVRVELHGIARDVELVGTPRVQEGPNLHVATSPDTVMVVSQNSQLRTHGPSRTEIVQQPDQDKKGQAKTSQTPAAQASPAPSLPNP